MKTLLAGALVALAPGLPASAAPAGAPAHVDILKAVARDIEALKREFPQLEEFSAARHLNIEHAKIVYGFRTHTAEKQGGWTSGVPNPDDDGVWFYIDIHDPDSNLQIHAQPVTASICLGAERVSFLILEGKSTNRLYGPIWKALAKHGARTCER